MSASATQGGHNDNEAIGEGRLCPRCATTLARTVHTVCVHCRRRPPVNEIKYHGMQ